jgi:U3 small nucleolar RNA-associated protein 22
MTAFDSLVEFLRKNTRAIADSSLGSKKKNVSKLGMPLAIDEVEPLSPCLRYSALFPPEPHPLLGGNTSGLDKRKVSGANDGSPILIQIRFEGTSKWPASMNAMGAAKCAMLIQLAEGIEKMKRERGSGDDDELSYFDGPMDVTPMYLDIGYRGYSWRIIVRADQELRMLRGLLNPTVEAKALRLSLINRHVRAAMHHSLIRAIHTRHPSAASVVRLAHRWVASHLLSDMIPHEAIELIVGKIYTETSGKSTALVCTPPATTVAGFLRFLHLLSTHDWAREPLIVDPQNHINYHDRELIHSQFTAVRGPEYSKGPAMYIISPADYDAVEDMMGSKVIGEAQKSLTDNVWAPTVTSNFPEKVVLRRAAALAKCSHDHLTACIIRGNGGKGWAAAFHESHASIMSFSALLRVEPSYITDPGCSSTNADATIDCDQFVTPFERCLQNRSDGVKELRKKFYKNLVLEKDTIHEWQPVRSLVNTLRARYNDYAVFFYNEFSPDIIAIIWRPDAFKPQPFSVIASDFKRPTSEVWKEDSPVITNIEDLMAEIVYIAKDIVTTFKVFDENKSGKI